MLVVPPSRYKTLALVFSDISLIFDNCREYNGLDSPYYAIADAAEALAHGMLQGLLRGDNR